jgi:hypothetical protein
MTHLVLAGNFQHLLFAQACLPSDAQVDICIFPRGPLEADLYTFAHLLGFTRVIHTIPSTSHYTDVWIYSTDHSVLRGIALDATRAKRRVHLIEDGLKLYKGPTYCQTSRWAKVANRLSIPTHSACARNRVLFDRFFTFHTIFCSCPTLPKHSQGKHLHHIPTYLGVPYPWDQEYILYIDQPLATDALVSPKQAQERRNIFLARLHDSSSLPILFKPHPREAVDKALLPSFVRLWPASAVGSLEYYLSSAIRKVVGVSSASLLYLPLRHATPSISLLGLCPQPTFSDLSLYQFFRTHAPYVSLPSTWEQLSLQLAPEDSARV